MKDDKEKINATLILEVIGKPQSYLIQTLDSLISQMGNEPGVHVKSKNIKEPKKMEEKARVANPSGKEVNISEKEFYVSFAEVEIEAENLSNLAYLMFKYMPAHVEIITPKLIPVANYEWNQILNDLIGRLHGYDEVARVLQVEKSILESKLKSILESKDIEENKAKGKKVIGKKKK